MLFCSVQCQHGYDCWNVMFGPRCCTAVKDGLSARLWRPACNRRKCGLYAVCWRCPGKTRYQTTKCYDAPTPADSWCWLLSPGKSVLLDTLLGKGYWNTWHWLAKWKAKERLTFLGWLERSTGYKPLDLIRIMQRRKENDAVTAVYTRTLASHHDWLIDCSVLYYSVCIDLNRPAAHGVWLSFWVTPSVPSNIRMAKSVPSCMNLHAGLRLAVFTIQTFKFNTVLVARLCR